MSLEKYYFQHNGLLADSLQLTVLKQLSQLQENILREAKLRSQFSILRKRKLIPGIYLWGSVGGGKTFLMDCFYRSLPIKQKQRIHFFKFMRFIHAQLKVFSGKKDPLAFIAKRIAQEIFVLCFDEFFVKDIADAMILGRLIKFFFKEGVCLTITSNIPPEKLYEKGLQRESFLPAIDLLNKFMQVIELNNSKDYRTFSQSDIDLFTDKNLSAKTMEEIFTKIADKNSINTAPIIINDRIINIRKKSSNAIWFNFTDICHVPRSSEDYLDIVQQYSTILISDIPVIGENNRNLIRLFMTMIDIFYDHHINLIFSSQVPIEKIYLGSEMAFEFQRTISRLFEMQNNNKFL